MKKNTAALVFAIIGAIFGVIGAIMWAACAEACAGAVGALGGGTGTPVGYMIGFLLLGIGGAVVGLIGGLQAFGYKKAGLPLSVLGLLLQIGNLILECVFVSGFSFGLSLCTLLAILLFLLQTCFAAKKQ